MLPERLKYLLMFVLAMISCESGSDEIRLFDCSEFRADLSHKQLIEIFGSKNVSTEKVTTGEEGEQEDASILFGDKPGRRVVIVWKDKIKKVSPRFVKVTHQKGYWETAHGIEIGTSLTDLEKINKGPFKLYGFGWRFSGRVSSWENGAIDPGNDECKLLVRLSPESRFTEPHKQHYYQVLGDRAFSSESPAMQALNPRVFQLLLSYR